MIERGNYIVPYFNNQLRLDKPPLTYWGQTASYHIFGENDFAARFPSAIAAALTALLILAWARRMEEKARLVGGDYFTLSLQTFFHAKAAVADMWLVLFMTLALWAGYELFQRPTGIPGAAVARRPWAILEIAVPCSLSRARTGFLAKGPIAWTPLLTVAG